ncbi:MAG: DEAD/DEAH box helicase [Lachnospiraceae bacterium]|nr:DEAD/DEAH box helicase [Lachnospiraceae bacterium]
MARRFTPKEVKDITAAVKQRLKQLDVIAQQRHKMQEKMVSEANLLLTSRAVQNDIEQVLRGGASASDEAAARLAETVYVFRNAAGYSMDAEEILKTYRPDIAAAVIAAAPAGSSFQWFFANRYKKQKAEQACQYLENTWLNDLEPRAEKIVGQMRKAMEDTAASAAAEFGKEPNKGEYRKTFDRLCPAVKGRSVTVPALNSLIKEHGDLLRMTDGAMERIAAIRNRIKGAAERLLTAQALEVLGEASVDEINKAYGGIRIKSLHDAGYHTIADITNAPVQRLAYIKGISEEKAHLLKQIAAGYVEEIRRRSKVRLSADARTREATELAGAILEYKERTGDYGTLLRISSACKEQIVRERSELIHALTGINWIFYTEEQKKKIPAARADLEKLLGSSYPQMVRTLSGRILQKTTPSAETVWNGFIAEPAAFYSILEEICPGVLGNDDDLYGLPEDLAHAIAGEVIYKEGLKCTLRRYQEWGVKYVLHQKKVLLGDEMGLGKTIQAIAAMVSLRNEGLKRFMVICPASVLANWCREIEKHSDLAVVRIHGQAKKAALKTWMRQDGVAVTTYETAEFLKETEFPLDMLVVDEAHYIKNPEAKRSVNVKLLCARTERLLFMTGTALENRVDEMVSLMKVLRLEIAREAETRTYMSAAPQFRALVAPVYYRRKREEVLTELPELLEVQEWCELGSEEKKIYRKTVFLRQFQQIRRVSWNAEKAEDSSKARRMLELTEEAASEGRKVLVYSFFLDTIAKAVSLLGERAYGPINGSVPPERRQQIIDEFEKAPAGSVLVAQILSGGTGLNIQSASVVIICEPQLKPSIENQAISRAYRMGQARNVLVYRLLCENTVDEHIMDILENKQVIFDSFADISAAADLGREIDEKTFVQIVEEERERLLLEEKTEESLS